MLLDERSEPSVRQVLGRLLAGSARADLAVAHVRLEGLDLSGGELTRLQLCRVLVGRLDAGTLAEVNPGGNAAKTARLRALLEFLESGRVEVRAAGAAAWSPDFSILASGERAVLLVGGHYFARPEPAGGAVLTCVTDHAQAAARARARFEELWQRGYDVLDVVREAVAAGLPRTPR